MRAPPGTCRNLNEDGSRGRELTLEPGPAVAAIERRECELVVIAKAGVEPGSRIAETFAGVTAPSGGSADSIGAREFSFAPFGAPSEFAPAQFAPAEFPLAQFSPGEAAGGARVQLGLENPFPTTA